MAAQQSFFDGKSFIEIAEYLARNSEMQMNAGEIGQLTKRLYEIALLDHHIPDVYRDGALKLLESVKDVAKNSFSEATFKIYEEINADMEQSAKQLGVGSLAWLITELEIPEDKIAEFVIRPEYDHLLKEFFSILSPDVSARLALQVLEIDKSRSGP